MLRGYFDDSGKARDRRVVVWGGVVGSVDQLSTLDDRWCKLLHEPLPEKPSLRQFHLTHCRSLQGEFRDYSRTESDHVQYLFREAILEAGVSPIAFGVDVAAWNDLVVGEIDEYWTDPEMLAFGSCARTAWEVAEDHECHMEAVFDQGAARDHLKTLLGAAARLTPGAVVNASFLEVGKTPGLQAADIVANSFFHHACQNWYDLDVEPDPHFLHLIKNVGDTNWRFYGREQIADLMHRIDWTTRPSDAP